MRIRMSNATSTKGQSLYKIIPLIRSAYDLFKSYLKIKAMPIQFDKFDQQKVDNLKTHLDSSAKKGTPKTYEIHVDGVKAVMKTDDPNEFYNYEAYMKEDTNEIKVIIYGSNNSPRNDQY